MNVVPSHRVKTTLTPALRQRRVLWLIWPEMRTVWHLESLQGMHFLKSCSVTEEQNCSHGTFYGGVQDSMWQISGIDL